MKLLRRSLAFVIIFMLVVELILGATIVFFMPDRYEAVATLSILPNTSDLSNEDYDLGSKLIHDFREIALSESVLEQTLQKVSVQMTANELRQRIKFESLTNSNLVRIRVWSAMPETSAALANALANSLIEEVQSRLQIDYIQMVEAASIPQQQTRTHIFAIMGFGLIGAFLLAILFLFIVECFDDTLREAEEIATIFGKPVIGQIPHGVTRLRRR